ncbi:phosphotransferase family protein [Sphingobium sp. V4]|uniref:phosphotransferase family protein n=1 Tax=Sphingobium sp. V4 TaxID=3038927 RepID=UPI0025580D14|nr:phosphotransferase family protein [Sphingobium sp. V4]WIW89438.1 phosphotransferase family protein [Sphingobium sp. V4]
MQRTKAVRPVLPENDFDHGPAVISLSRADLLVLASIRHGLRSHVAEELASPMARTICNFSVEALDRLIASHESWPAILADRIKEQAGALGKAAALLSGNGAIGKDEALAISVDADACGDVAHLPLAELEQAHRVIHTWLERIAAPLMRACAAGDREADTLFSAFASAYGESRQKLDDASQTRADHYATEAEKYVRVTRESFERYLIDRFPERKNLAVTSFKELPGGSSKTTLLVDVKGLESEEVTSIVVRMDRQGGSTDTKAVNEAPVLAAAYRHGFPVAELLWVEPDPDAVGLAFIAVRKVDAEPAGGMQGAVAPDCGPAIGMHIAGILARLHAMNPAEFGLPEDTGEHPMRPLIDNARRLWLESKLEPDGLIECCLCWLEENLPPRPERLSLIHGDIGVHNLLISGNRIAAILDWELFHLGDPVEELAYARNSIEAIMPWDEFLAEYQRHGGGDYLEETARYYRVWVAVRNVIYTQLCKHAFYTGENPDLRWATYASYQDSLQRRALSRILADCS